MSSGAWVALFLGDRHGRGRFDGRWLRGGAQSDRRRCLFSGRRRPGPGRQSGGLLRRYLQVGYRLLSRNVFRRNHLSPLQGGLRRRHVRESILLDGARSRLRALYTHRRLRGRTLYERERSDLHGVHGRHVLDWVGVRALHRLRRWTRRDHGLLARARSDLHRLRTHRQLPGPDLHHYRAKLPAVRERPLSEGRCLRGLLGRLSERLVRAHRLRCRQRSRLRTVHRHRPLHQRHLYDRQRSGVQHLRRRLLRERRRLCRLRDGVRGRSVPERDLRGHP